MKCFSVKWFVTGLFVALCVLVMAGCSGNSKPESVAPSNEKSKESTAPATKQAPEPEKVADEEPVEIEMMTLLLQDVPEMDNAYYSELQKLTNSKLNIIWVPDADYQTRFDLVMASGDIPEVIAQTDYNKPTLTQAIEQGAFWDLTSFLGDYSEYPNLRDKLTPGSWKYVNYSGKIMGIPRPRSMIDAGIKMRKDWLEELNIPVPETVEQYKEALKAIVAAKPNVIGTLDDPLNNSSSIRAAYGVMDPTYDDDGGMIRDILTPQFEEVVAFYRDLYAEGLMATEFTALNNPQRFDLLTTSRAASMQYSIYRDLTWTADIKKTDPDGELFTLPPLLGPKNYGAVLDIGTRGAFYINKKVPEDKVKKILAYFEKTASEEVTNLGYYGKEGVHHEVVDGQPILNDLGKEEIQVTALNPLVPAYTKWGKVHYSGVSRAENEAKEKEAEPYETYGKVNPFAWIYSQTWIDTWPDYDSSFQSHVTRATVGEISMEEFHQFVEGIRNDPKIKQAFKEFAADYEARNDQ